MLLIWTCNKYVKVCGLDNVIHCLISKDIVHISNSFNHIHSLFRTIYEFCLWLIFENDIRILYCNNQIITYRTSLTKKIDMTYMEQIIHSHR